MGLVLSSPWSKKATARASHVQMRLQRLDAREDGGCDSAKDETTMMVRLGSDKIRASRVPRVRRKLLCARSVSAPSRRAIRRTPPRAAPMLSEPASQASGTGVDRTRLAAHRGGACHGLTYLPGRGFDARRCPARWRRLRPASGWPGSAARRAQPPRAASPWPTARAALPAKQAPAALPLRAPRADGRSPRGVRGEPSQGRGLRRSAAARA